ncbi:MAG: AEC family transporter [Pseudomonadota bacterium]
MLEIIRIVVPFFGLIGLGFALLKVGYLSRDTGRYVTEFAVKVAMPVFLFRAMISIGTFEGSPFLLVAAYFAATAVTWLLAAVLTWSILRRPQTDAASLAMGATFSNSVMLGVPLALLAFGPSAAAPAALLISLDTPLLWIAATLHLESFRKNRDGSLFAALGGIAFNLVKNPIIAGLLAGTAFRLSGLTLPPLLDKTTELIAAAAVPAMLLGLGMSIATYKLAGQAPSLVVVNMLKLAVMPALAYLFAFHVFDVPPVFAAVVVLFAAMPVGANAFLFAARYDVAVGTVSTSIVISTAIAIFSVTALLFVLKTTL